MTNEELQIGAQWMAILNAYSHDFTTKALFNQTANYLKHNHGQKVRDTKFKRELKAVTVLNENVKQKPKTIGLMEAAKKREELEEPTNLLAIDETDGDLLPKKGRKKDV
jgi:hypothetical protein